MTGERVGEVPFQAHIELLRTFLARRDEIVESIEGLLNAQRKPDQYLRDRPLLSRQIGDCFFTPNAIDRDPSGLRNQLEEAHWASGFKPRQTPGNDLIDAAEMMVRGFHLWQQTRWPGRNGRARFAQALFNSYVIRRLTLLSMRLWDAGSGSPGERLTQVQDVLDELWRTAPVDQPTLVRDARWLIPVALSPTTDELGGYFDVSERISEGLSKEDQLEIYTAGVRLAAGHLRSQLRHYILTKGVSLDENRLVLNSRQSNALDFALLIQWLAPLLEAYEHAVHAGSSPRLELADTICQGLSADPELFLNRIELLGPYSMLENLFATADRDGHAAYTPMGQRHVRLLQEYETRIGRSAKALSDDCARFRPIAGVYSPYGVLYGFSSNLLELMALKTLQPDAPTHFSLEDVFTAGGADKLAWVNGWRKLPHIDAEVLRAFEYPEPFAEEIFDRIDRELGRRASDVAANAAVRAGRLYVLSADDPLSDSKTSQIPDVPLRYVGSSDPQVVAMQKAETYDPAQLLRDRQEGFFVVSFETSGGWTAVTKDVLTELLGAGRDAKITALPPAAAGVLRLTCPKLVVLPETSP